MIIQSHRLPITDYRICERPYFLLHLLLPLFRLVEKESFQTLIKNYTSLTSEEASELISLQDDFPYSQVIRNLCSRAAQDHMMGSREKLLHLSAIYTTERFVLKTIMSAARKERRPVERTAPSLEITQLRVSEKEVGRTPAKEVGRIIEKNELIPSGEALINDIYQELERLKESKQKFELSVQEFDRVNSFSPEGDAKKKNKKITVSAEPADSLIEEIKTKKKVKPDGPKQKEQIEIIENFIKTQPTITKNKLNSPPSDSSDLAEKSLLYGDNIVSETLVEILLKQGKKDKAIEVLKKLIWKFPQKKAYFAAQIEDLKK